MSQVRRADLELSVLVRDAAEVIRAFLENDDDCYPYADFIMRNGISKVLAEEYLPLVRVAEVMAGSRAVRLLPASNTGPDGEIEFGSGEVWHVQITCAHEGYEAALAREQMRNGELTGSGRKRRDKATGGVVYIPEGFGPKDGTASRVDRITEAVRKKESKYREGTDTLIVQDDPDDIDYLQAGRFRDLVKRAVRELGPSRYQRIFVVYGQTPDCIV